MGKKKNDDQKKARHVRRKKDNGNHGNSSGSSSESSSTEEHPPGEQGDAGDKRLDAIRNSPNEAGADGESDGEEKAITNRGRSRRNDAQKQGPNESEEETKVDEAIRSRNQYLGISVATGTSP